MVQDLSNNRDISEEFDLAPQL